MDSLLKTLSSRVLARLGNVNYEDSKLSKNTQGITRGIWIAIPKNVIPAKVGIQCSHSLTTLRTDWTPVFTGVTVEIQFRHAIKKRRREYWKSIEP